MANLSFLPPNMHQDAGQSRLQAIGLSIEEARFYGLTILSSQETTEELGYCHGSGSIRIQYYTTQSREMDFSRYRFLDYKGKGKYRQSRKGVEIYLPRADPEYWPLVFKDPKQSLIITEGEFKALTTHLAIKDVPCLAVGGVESWAEKGQLHSLLQTITLKNRVIYLAFDSDLTINPDVQRAEYKLTAIFRAYGARVFPLRWPLELGKGLDDYIQNGNSVSELLANSRETTGFNEENQVYQFLSEWGMYQGKPIHFESGSIWKMADFHAHFSNMAIELDGKHVPVSRLWQLHKYRMEIQAVDLDPSTENIVLPNKTLNTWRGWSVEPINQTPTKWLELCKIFFSKEPGAEEFFHNYMGLLIRHPEVKQFIVPIFQGYLEGTGKSTLLEMPAKLMKGNGRILGSTELDDNFNEWAVHVKYCVFNEPGEKGAHISNKIKNYATAPEITIRPMYNKPFKIVNRINLAMTTNNEYTHVIGSDSRREWIVSPPKETKQFDFRGFYQDYDKELGRILNFYLNLDTGDYDGKCIAPSTKTKQEVIEASMTPVEAYIYNLNDNDLVFPPLEINEAENKWRVRTTLNKFTRVLRKYNYEPIRDTQFKLFGYQGYVLAKKNPKTQKWFDSAQDVDITTRLRAYFEKKHGA